MVYCVRGGSGDENRDHARGGLAGSGPALAGSAVRSSLGRLEAELFGCRPRGRDRRRRPGRAVAALIVPVRRHAPGTLAPSLVAAPLPMLWRGVCHAHQYVAPGVSRSPMARGAPRRARARRMALSSVRRADRPGEDARKPSRGRDRRPRSTDRSRRRLVDAGEPESRSREVQPPPRCSAASPPLPAASGVVSAYSSRRSCPVGAARRAVAHRRAGGAVRAITST